MVQRASLQWNILIDNQHLFLLTDCKRNEKGVTRHNNFSWTSLSKGERCNGVSTNPWDKARLQHRELHALHLTIIHGGFLDVPCHVTLKIQETVDSLYPEKTRMSNGNDLPHWNARKNASIMYKSLYSTGNSVTHKCAGSLTSPASHVTLKMKETGPTVHSLYPRRLERSNGNNLQCTFTEQSSF